MFREQTTSYLRHIHLVVHSAQQRFRLPVYIIQTETPPPVPFIPSPSEVFFTNENDVYRPREEKKISKRYACIPLLSLILCLLTAIALLASLLARHKPIHHCPIYDCSWTNITTSSYDTNSYISTHFLNTNELSYSQSLSTSVNSNTNPLSTSQTTVNNYRLYGENCSEHHDCILSKHLYCQYEFDFNQKHCFCETTYFWNKNTQQCEPKKDVNEVCEYDNECRVDLGITCDLPSGSIIRHCSCMGEYYWSKISNCGDLKIQDFVHCVDEIYISSCLIKELENGIYHNVNIRQIENDQLEFDYFLLDSPDIQEIERSECTWSIKKRYCFGVDNETNKLLIFIIDLHGVESYHHINHSVIGLPNVFTQTDQTVICYVESNNSNLISITINPNNNDLLTVQQRNGKTFGERSCFLAVNLTSYCFYRDIEHRLAAIAMNGPIISQDKQMIIDTDTNLKTGPSCGWVGTSSLFKLYCFAVFNNEKIHRIEQKDNMWNNWTMMTSEKIFIQRPLFITSKPPEDTSINQSCHVLAIDTSNELYVSSNTNCAHQDLFSSWLLLQTDVGLLSFNGSFRLRDGRVGVYGIGIDDLPYYTTMDPITHSFETVKLAISTD